MPSKKVIQDIVPNGKRTIRNIPIDDREEIQSEVVEKPKPTLKKGIEIRKIVEEQPVEVVEEPVVEPKRVREPGMRKPRRGGKYLLTFVIVFICIGIIALALSLSYSKAVVTITPKIANFDINGTFTAKKDASLGDLSYEVVTLSEEERQTLPATQGSMVETKAKGTMTIYNNYSAAAQTLVAGTRLAVSDGLVYRTTNTISVPGKKTTAGSVNVEVVADQAGEKYNKAVTSTKEDFKIVAFKGTDRYAGFYGQLKTDLSGGYSGYRMTVDEEAKSAAVSKMKASIDEKIKSKLVTTVPNDYVYYDNSYDVVYDVSEPMMKDASTAEIVVKETVNLPIFKTDSLVKYIAGSELKKFPGEMYRIDGEENLEFKISNSKDFSAEKGTPLIFTLKGPISVVGTFSEEKLREELKGVGLSESNAIFAKYASISNAYALITPFWMRSFPNTTDKIIIEYK